MNSFWVRGGAWCPLPLFLLGFHLFEPVQSPCVHMPVSPVVSGWRSFCAVTHHLWLFQSPHPLLGLSAPESLHVVQLPVSVMTTISCKKQLLLGRVMQYYGVPRLLSNLNSFVLHAGQQSPLSQGLLRRSGWEEQPGRTRASSHLHPKEGARDWR